MMTPCRRLLLSTALLLAGTAPRGGETAGENATTVPVPAFQPLAGVAVPGEIPAKSRVLLHEEIWELPDVLRTEQRASYIVHSFEQTRIVQEVIFTGRDAGEIGEFQSFFDGPEQRLEAFEGEIRYPDGRRVPLTRSVNLLEKASVTRHDRRGGGDDEAVARKPDERLWWLVVPGVPPGAAIEYRAVMHYHELDYLNRGYADGRLPIAHYRLRVRSNQSLYILKGGVWRSGWSDKPLDRSHMKMTRERKADFNPRGKRGFWHITHERWWADVKLLPQGSSLRIGAEQNDEDRHETEILADDLPAHEHEPVQPDDETVRPLVLAYYSPSAPSAGLAYWEREYPKPLADDLKTFLSEKPSAGELDLKAILGDAGEADKADAAARWLQIHFSTVVDEKKTATFREARRQLRGAWYVRHFLLAAVLREAGLAADLALVFHAHDLPVVPELTDARFYPGPYLAVRVEQAGRVEYYAPDDRDLSAARLPNLFRGAVAYRFWAELPAVRESVSFADRRGDRESYRLALKLDASGRAAGTVDARYEGLTAARVRGRLKTDKPLVIEIDAKDAGRSGELLKQKQSQQLEQASVSAETMLKERLGGVPAGIKTRPYVADDPSGATLSGGWSEDGYAPGNFPALVSPLALQPLFEKAERRYPVFDRLPESHRLDFTLELPEGKRAAQPGLAAEIEGPGGYRFSVHAEMKAGRWTGYWELREADHEVPAAEYPKLREAEQRAFELLQRKMPLVAENPPNAPGTPGGKS